MHTAGFASDQNRAVGEDVSLDGFRLAARLASLAYSVRFGQDNASVWFPDG